MTALPSLTPVIAGPTAGGKSTLAVELAHELASRGIRAEIITADAFQIYTGLDIGTAKPTPEERRGIPHHLIDLVPRPSSLVPSSSPFTVNDWLQLATAKIAELRAANILPIVVGGTHLYIKALLDGLFEGPQPDPVLREQLAAMDPAARRAELEHVDPVAAARIHPNDLRRTIRALEVFRLTGKPISQHQRQWDRAVLPDARCPVPDAFLLTILDWDPEPLNRQINARVRQMIEGGLLEEVRALLATGGFTPQSAEALGYKQLLSLSAGAPPAPHTLDAAIEQIKIETRRFAKNQRTWLRRLRTTPGCLALPFPTTSPAEAVAAITRRIGAVGSEDPPI